jgi:hypothetical protein
MVDMSGVTPDLPLPSGTALQNTGGPDLRTSGGLELVFQFVRTRIVVAVSSPTGSAQRRALGLLAGTSRLALASA